MGNRKRNHKGVPANHAEATSHSILNELNAVQPTENQEAVDEDGEGYENGLAIVETYADYWPAKLKIGAKHPDPVVETAALASVESADINYELKIPSNIIKEGLLSALQLESIAYASQAHEKILLDDCNTRAGFLIGDGAGVGKGRTIAGIFYENYLRGRKKSIWISVSNDLKYDAERDLRDIGAKIEVHSLKEFKYNTRINSTTNGKIDEGVIFATYALLIAKSNTNSKFASRMAQLVDWFGESYDGCIVFDECHKAKNLIRVNAKEPTKTGKAVLQLQQLLPNARVVYSSATGASEPINMGYMNRLGLWGVGTAFKSFQEFHNIVERRGVGAMEIMAMDMKLRGMYVARQLSFKGVTFNVEEVPITDDFKSTYNDSVALWNLAFKEFENAAYLMKVNHKTRKIIFSQFWGAHQRFFKYLAISAKVDHTVKIALEAVKSGKCVVIGLQSTGEARTLEELDKCEGDLDDYISTAKAVFQSLVEKQFPALDQRYKKLSPKSTENASPTENESASTSRKRQLQAVRAVPTRLATKRPRLIVVSSDDSSQELSDVKSESEESDNDEEYTMDDKEDPGNESSSSENAEMSAEESDFEPETESYVSESENSNDFATPSEDSDSEFEDWNIDNKENIRFGHKSTNNLSKVQEYIIKQYGESVAEANKSSKTNSKIILKDDVIETVCTLKNELLRKIDELGERLPPNTLDDLILKLGGSKKVAEMTGRKGRIATKKDGTVQYESRSENGVSLEMLNITEKERFMEEDKVIAIISEAASSGISLQSDRRVRNQRRRVHITLELPWSADRAIQQFGRTHRSNQVNAPEYVFLISDLAGERRFVSTVAKRLESLGALTHADRRATQTRDLSQFNIDNKYGRRALASMMRVISKYEVPLIQPPEDYKGNFFSDVRHALLDVGLNLYAVADEDRKSDNIAHFLNRTLGVPVDLQNRIFEYFSDTLNAMILKAKKECRFDQGILDLGRPEKVTRMNTKRFFRKHATGIAPVELHTVRHDRGMSFGEALEKSKTLSKPYEGFYVNNEYIMDKKRAILAQNISDDNSLSIYRTMLRIYRPNTGLGMCPESVADIQRTYSKASSEKAGKHWNYQYESSVTTCNHAFWSGKCKQSIIGDCDVGMRILTSVVLSGSVLGVWDRVEQQLCSDDEKHRLQVVRVHSSDGHKTIGLLIPKQYVRPLIVDLSEGCEVVQDETFVELLD